MLRNSLSILKIEALRTKFFWIIPYIGITVHTAQKYQQNVPRGNFETTVSVILTDRRRLVRSNCERWGRRV